MARNEWQGNYYLTGSGAMATDEVIMDGTRYIFAASGELKEKKDLNVGWVHRDGKRYFFNNREEQVEPNMLRKSLILVSTMVVSMIGKRLLMRTRWMVSLFV